jgi:chitodextrinase
VTGLTYTVAGLSASTAYTFTVKAKDAAGNVSACKRNYAYSLHQMLPLSNRFNSLRLQLHHQLTNWTASTDNVAVTGYDVYQGNFESNCTSTSYAVTGLTASTAYTSL